MHKKHGNIDILIVEDSQTQALRLQISLEQQGYQSVVANNGLDAIRLLRKRFFSLVITDWIMPHMDGFEFCKTIRRYEFEGYVYIILLTAKDSKNDVINGLKAGADDYLIKPVDPAELFARLNTAKRIITLEHSLRKRNKEITLLSITDHLTRVYNRGYLNDHLVTVLKYAFRYNHPLAIMICDIDHFKKVNDQYGHQTGDMVLKKFADCLKQTLRDGADWLARYGGEEFIIVMPETELTGALIAAERHRRRIAEMVIESGSENEPIRITASFGVACILPSKKGKKINMETLIEEADKCLYLAKKEGRNRCSGASLG